MRILKAYLQYKFTARRVTEVSSWRTISYSQRLTGGVGSRQSYFLFIKLAKNDRIYYFIMQKVIVFNTNLKKKKQL